MNLKLLLLTILIYCYSSNLKAQNRGGSSSATIVYKNEQKIMREFTVDIKDLIEKGVLLTSKNAKKQLREVNNKPVHLSGVIPPKYKILNSKKVYQRSINSVVLIGLPYKSKKNNRFRIITATGYIIDSSGVVVTNDHVVENFVKNPRDPLGIFMHTNNGKTYQVKKILSTSKDEDLAIVQLETRGDKLKPLPVGNQVPIGSTVFVLGNPEHMIDFYSKGIVARYVTRNKPLGHKLKYGMTITADAAVGSSGSPVIDIHGNVVGTFAAVQNFYTRVKERSILQIMVKATIPVSELKKLIIF